MTAFVLHSQNVLISFHKIKGKDTLVGDKTCAHAKSLQVWSLDQDCDHGCLTILPEAMPGMGSAFVA